MTLTIPQASPPSLVSPHHQPSRRRPGHRRRLGRRRQWLAQHPAWPLTALLAGYPIWWLLGLADESVFILAVPMLLQMRTWRRHGLPIKVPPGFGLWLLFLICVAAGAATLGVTAPDTVTSAVSNRVLSFVDRGLTYGGLTVILLYAGNLTEAEQTRRRLAWLLGLVGLFTTIGGIGGVIAPRLQFKSPLAYVLPHSMQQNTLLQAALYPGLSQVTSVLGISEGRPKAPFEYTNTWGDCLTILLPWLVVAWWSYGGRRQRRWLLVAMAIALIPVVYSLNRTAWVAIVLMALYFAVRMAARGKVAMLGMVLASLAIVVVAVVATPLQGLITSRLQHQQSNSIRALLSVAAVNDANAAPLIGYGDTRHLEGSAQSIAVGPTATCPTCGQYAVGSNGQLYLLMVCNGWLGTLLFLGFFAWLAWRYRRDKSPYGMVGVLVILLSFVYMFAYTAVTAPLEFTVLAAALLWRNDQWRRGLARADGLRGPRMPLTAVAAWTARAASQGSLAPMPAALGTSAVPAPSVAAAPPARPPASRADGRLRELARGSLLNLIGAAVAGLSLIVMTVVITRSFSKATAGAFFTAMSLFLIVEAVVSLGAATGSTYFIARLRSLGQSARVPEVVRTATRPVAVCSVVAAIALAVFAQPVARLLVGGQLGQAGARPSEVAGELRALAVALPFAAMLDTLLGASRGFRAMAPTAAVDRIGRPMVQLAGTVLAAAAGSAALLAPVWALPYVPAAVVVWWWFRRIQRRAAVGPDRGEPGAPVGSGLPALARGAPLGFWRFTGPRGLAALAQITIQRINIVLVALIRGPAEAAVYTAATRFLVAGQFGSTAISMAATPRFTEMFAVGDRHGANRVYQATTAWLILLTWPFYLLAVTYGHRVLEVFGHSYGAGAAVMVILGLTMLLSMGCGQVDMVLITTGRSSWSLMNGLLAVVVNVVIDVALIPRYGITGAAIGWSAAIVVTNLMPLAQIAVTERLHPAGRGTVVAAVLSAVAFAALPLTVRALAGPGLLPSLAAISCGCIVLALGMWRFRTELNLAAMPGTAQLVTLLSRVRYR